MLWPDWDALITDEIWKSSTMLLTLESQPFDSQAIDSGLNQLLGSLTTTTTAAKTSQICIFDNEKQYFCTLCTCIFHLLTLKTFSFFLRREMTTEFNFVFLCPKRWFQFNSRIVGTHFPSIFEKWLQKREVTFPDDVLASADVVFAKGWFSYNRRYRFDRPGLRPIARIEQADPSDRGHPNRRRHKRSFM